MERGYLAGLLLVLAVFTGMSHGIRSLEQWSLKHVRHVSLMARSECRARSTKQSIANLDMRPTPGDAEGPQLLAELNLPPNLQSNAVQAAAAEDIAGLSCARARAMQQAARARRDMLRAQHDLMQMRMEPLAIKVNLPPDFAEQVQKSTAAAMDLARQQMQVSLQIERNRIRAVTRQAASEQ